MSKIPDVAQDGKLYVVALVHKETGTQSPLLIVTDKSMISKTLRDASQEPAMYKLRCFGEILLDAFSVDDLVS